MGMAMESMMLLALALILCGSAALAASASSDGVTVIFGGYLQIRTPRSRA